MAVKPDARIAISVLYTQDQITISLMADLWVETWSKAMPGIDFSARRAWILHRIGCSPCTLAAQTDQDRWLGFALLDPATGQLDQLAVATAAYGTGVATALLNRVKTICRDTVSLDVNADNARALHFYKREGFVQRGLGVNERSGLPTIAMRWTKTNAAASGHTGAG